MEREAGVPPGEAAAEALRARDRLLVERLRAGDAGAFDELWALYRDPLHRLAWRFTGDAEDALDVVQEAFCYLLRKLPGLELSARLSTFLYPVVRHLAAEARRRRERRVEAGEVLGELCSREASPAAAAAPGDRELLALVRGLPEGQREVVLLRYADGLEQAEIAEALGVPIGTVKSRLHHAQRALRDDPRVRALREEGTG